MGREEKVLFCLFYLCFDMNMQYKDRFELWHILSRSRRLAQAQIAQQIAQMPGSYARPPI